jgi:PAS domain S-box-containing protein
LVHIQTGMPVKHPTKNSIRGHKKAQEGLLESQAQLEAELADTKLLQGISSELIYEDNLQSLFEKIVDAAVRIMRSEYASMQMLCPERGSSGELRLLAFRGFNPQAAKFWEWVGTNAGSTCGVALRTGQRVIVHDVEKCDFMQGTEDLAMFLQTGIHACQTTPLFSRYGKMVGMISTHWHRPHQPSARDLLMCDILAGQAADLIDRAQASEMLRESQLDLKRAQAVALTGSWRLDLKRNEARCSEETYRIFGIPMGIRMTYESFLAVVHPEDRACVDRKWKATLKGEQYDIEHRIIAGKTVKWIRGKAEREYDSRGEMIGAFGTVQDITDRKQAEEALDRSQTLLRAVMDGTSDPIYIKDKESRILLANQALAEVIGKPLIEIIGKTDGEYYGDSTVGQILRNHDIRVMESGKNEITEETVPTPYGDRTFLSSKVPYWSEAGDIVGILGISHDITDRKRAEVELRESEERFRVSAESSLDAFTILEAVRNKTGVIVDFRWTYVNPKAGRILLHPPQELLANASSKFFRATRPTAPSSIAMCR